jgi:hypothetical protein
MRYTALLGALMACGLVGCAGAPMTSGFEKVFDDADFAPPAEPINGAAALEVSPEMRAYLKAGIAPRIGVRGPRHGLFEAMREDLSIDYDAAITRTAAEAFAARSGNCLSLVMLTAAFARELGVPVSYQEVVGVDTWSRSGGFTFHSGHVNLSLERAAARYWTSDPDPPMTVDFVPISDALQRVARPIDETTVIAMYLNNRAAEILADGDPARAYWWARESIRTAPAFVPAYNTLGVIYGRRGLPQQAELTLRVVLEREPANVQALSNLGKLFADEGRTGEAHALEERRAAIEPYPPFYFYDQGLRALQRDDSRAALVLFAKELKRMPYDDELHFAIAVANLRLGKVQPAREHLLAALDNSTTRSRHELYAAKLSHLRELQRGS